MRRNLTSSLLLPLFLLPVACSRQQDKVPAATRPVRVPAPTRDAILNEREQEIRKQLDPVLRLEKGVNFETPDGEKWIRYPNNLLIHDLKRTDQAEAHWGQTVHVAYTLTRPGNTKVIEKYTKENPMEFIVGSRDVIAGFNMAIMGMTTGGKRRVFLPPELAYGKAGAPTKNIGPDEPLIFEVELLSVTGNALQMPSPIPKPDPMGPPAPTTGPGNAPGIMSP